MMVGQKLTTTRLQLYIVHTYVRFFTMYYQITLWGFSAQLFNSKYLCKSSMFVTLPKCVLSIL